MHETDLRNLDLVHRGKVRDMYAIPGHPDKLLVVATDRISAFDVVIDSVMGKGSVLTNMTVHWLKLLKDVVPNHFITANVDEYPEICKQYEEVLWGRSMIVKKLTPLPAEFIVRGYISGSLWKAYLKAISGSNSKKNVLGHSLRDDMLESEKFDEPLFTPSTKAEAGSHDENISIKQMTDILTQFLIEHNFSDINPDEFAANTERIVLQLYEEASSFALERGMIIADTKFELAIDDEGVIYLIDEVLTPDSSRFWPLDQYEVGHGQPSFDKQFLRDYLNSIDWDKKAPAPTVPLNVLIRTSDLYAIAESMLLKV